MSVRIVEKSKTPPKTPSQVVLENNNAELDCWGCINRRFLWLFWRKVAYIYVKSYTDGTYVSITTESKRHKDIEWLKNLVNEFNKIEPANYTLIILV